jgi:hypothetical protein
MPVNGAQTFAGSLARKVDKANTLQNSKKKWIKTAWVFLPLAERTHLK